MPTSSRTREHLSVEWSQLVSFDLTDNDPIAAVKVCLTDHELHFAHYSPNCAEPVIGYTHDRVAVRAHVIYRPPLTLSAALPHLTERLKERMAVRVAILINTAKSLNALAVTSAAVELQLLDLARSIMAATRSIKLGRTSGRARRGTLRRERGTRRSNVRDSAR